MKIRSGVSTLIIMASSWLVVMSGVLSYEAANEYSKILPLSAIQIYAFVGVPFSIIVILIVFYLKDGRVLFGGAISRPCLLIYVFLGVSFLSIYFSVIYLIYPYVFPYFPEKISQYVLVSSVNIFDYKSSGFLLIFLLLLESTLLAPLWEELVFRGVLLSSLLKFERIGKTGAAIISSMMFSSMHSDVMSTFIFGMLLCFITIKTQSLWPAILTHISYNFLIGMLELWNPVFPILIVYLPINSELWYEVLDVLVVPFWWGVANAIVGISSMAWVFLYYIPKKKQSNSKS